MTEPNILPTDGTKEFARVQNIVGKDRVHALLYPEYAAGGFAPNSHFIAFFNRVNSLVAPNSRILDFGAGRGKFQETEQGWQLQLANFKGRCASVIGVDVDPVVLENEMTDENYVIEADGSIPLPSASVDLISSWAVFEHVADPNKCAQELDRVLKPGGWICAWTPNKWGYVGIGARLVPNKFHAQILRRIGVDGRRDEDVFPVAYRLNTRSALLEHFPLNKYEHHVAIRNGPPGYHGGSVALAKLIQFYGYIMPSPGRAMLHIFMRKKP